MRAVTAKKDIGTGDHFYGVTAMHRPSHELIQLMLVCSLVIAGRTIEEIPDELDRLWPVVTDLEKVVCQKLVYRPSSSDAKETSARESTGPV